MTSVDLIVYKNSPDILQGLRVDATTLETQRTELKRYQQRDRERSVETRDEALKRFKKGTRWLDRILGKVKFVPPEREDSLETRLYTSLVTVGDVLNKQVERIERFSAEYRKLAEQYQVLSEKRDNLSLKIEQIQAGFKLYPQEVQNTTNLLRKLETYTTLNEEGKENLRN